MGQDKQRVNCQRLTLFHDVGAVAPAFVGRTCVDTIGLDRVRELFRSVRAQTVGGQPVSGVSWEGLPAPPEPSAGRVPRCGRCGRAMLLVRIWDQRRGMIYDLFARVGRPAGGIRKRFCRSADAGFRAVGCAGSGGRRGLPVQRQTGATAVCVYRKPGCKRKLLLAVTMQLKLTTPLTSILSRKGRGSKPPRENESPFSERN